MKRFAKIKALVSLGLIIALFGVAVSFYTVMHHFTVKAQGESSFVCNINEVFSCDKVALSQYSEILGIPLGVWGVGYFVAIIEILILSLIKNFVVLGLQTYAAMGAIGIGVSIVAGSISYFLIGGFCPSCMVIYFITLLQIINILLFWKIIPKPFNITKIIFGGIYCSIAVIVIILIFKTAEPLIQDFTSANTKTINQIQSAISKNQLPPTIDFSFKKFNITILKDGDNEDYRKGNETNPRVVLTVFSDFKCPACERFAKYLDTLFEKYKDNMLVVFKNYPLDKECNPHIKSDYHHDACLIAAAARCVGKKGYFWKFHDLAFAKRTTINKYNIVSLLEELGLGSIEADACLNNKSLYYNKIKSDILEGGDFVEGTPTLLLNGYKFIGTRYDAIEEMIKTLINNTSVTIIDVLKENLTEIKKYIQSDKAILVDVREQGEWNSGHIENAKLVSISKMQKFKSITEFQNEFPQDKIIYTYCQSGSRAMMVAEVLRSIGYQSYAIPIALDELPKYGFNLVK